VYKIVTFLTPDRCSWHTEVLKFEGEFERSLTSVLSYNCRLIEITCEFRDQSWYAADILHLMPPPCSAAIKIKLRLPLSDRELEPFSDILAHFVVGLCTRLPHVILDAEPEDYDHQCDAGISLLPDVERPPSNRYGRVSLRSRCCCETLLSCKYQVLYLIDI
jgi:hypothetical protein